MNLKLAFLILISGYVIAEEDDVCTQGFGHGLWTRAKKMFTIPNPNLHTKFFLYTRNNPNISQELIEGDVKTFNSSYFNPKKPIRILVPGYMNVLGSCFNVKVRTAYLKRMDCNVIVVDWSAMSVTPYYLNAVRWVDKVADKINEFTTFIHEHFGVSYDNMYMIGHSLGAHLAGVAGKKRKPDLYNTIFALDPAGPGMNIFKPEYTIMAGDAFYVESIHTDMGKMGYKGQMGNASIYPDYGIYQKKCKYYFHSVCHHAEAFELFANSLINPEKYIPQPCDSFEDILHRKCECKERNDCYRRFQMGNEPSEKKEGVYYLNI